MSIDKCETGHYDWHKCGTKETSTHCDECKETKKCFELISVGSDYGIFCNDCYNNLRSN